MTNQDHIVIELGDLEPPRVLNVPPEMLMRLDGIEFMVGVPTIPTQDGQYWICPKNTPYAFYAHKAYLTDATHHNVPLDDVVVVMGHAIHDGRNWTFLNGQPVEATLEAVNRYISSFGIDAPLTGLVIACNPLPQTEVPIILADLPSDNIVYSAGEAINIHPGTGTQSHYEGFGMSVVNISVTGEFWNLDRILIERAIRLL
ncbi:MAG: hypothetical protein ABIG95_03830 [Candidatus Woesearchaeota archaeon]